MVWLQRQSWLVLVAMLSIVGCSSSPPPTEGIVRFDDGQPVRSGSIEFRSLQSSERYSGRISDNGTFCLYDKDGEPGCPPGEFEVVVVQIVLTEDLAIEAHDHGRTVPRRYADYYTSGLRVKQSMQRKEPLLILLTDDAGDTP